MITFLRKMFTPPPPPTNIDEAKKELAEAKLSHLKAQTDAEYAAACVTKHQALAAYHLTRIYRLNAYLADHKAT